MNGNALAIPLNTRPPATSSAVCPVAAASALPIDASSGVRPSRTAFSCSCAWRSRFWAVYCVPDAAVAAAAPASGVPTNDAPIPAAAGATSWPREDPSICLKAFQFCPSPNLALRYLDSPAAIRARRFFSEGSLAKAVASSTRPIVWAPSISELQKPASSSTLPQLLGLAGSPPRKRKPSSTSPCAGGRRSQLPGSPGLPPRNR